MSDESGFYEDDQPVEEIGDAFVRGEKGVTSERTSAGIQVSSVERVQLDPLRERPQVVLADVRCVKVA